MHFIFSKNISTERKLKYFGLMLIILSLVLVSMSGFDADAQKKVWEWAATSLISGVSIMLLVIISFNTRLKYKHIGFFASVLTIIFLVPFSIILTYLTFFLVGFPQLGDVYVIGNSNRTIIVSLPLLSIVEALLCRFGKKINVKSMGAE